MAASIIQAALCELYDLAEQLIIKRPQQVNNSKNGAVMDMGTIEMKGKGTRD